MRWPLRLGCGVRAGVRHGVIRWRSATSGTRSPTSTTTRATRRRARSPGRSCSGSSTTPTSRSSGRCGPKRKGALAAYRDATLFKVLYGWGLRRTETVEAGSGRLGAGTRRRRSSAGSGCCNVRYGKAKRGQPPRRRNVASVMGWAVEAVADYVDNIRPRFGCDGSSGVVGDRAGRADQAGGDQRPVRRLPRRAGAARGAGAAFDAPFVRHASDRGRCRPPVHPVPGGARVRHLDGDLHALSAATS